MSEGSPKSVTQTGEEPTKIIEIDGKKFEVGPNLGEMSWDDMNEKVVELNKTLKEGEKPWIVFDRLDYRELGDPIKEIWNKKDLSDTEKTSKIAEYVRGLGFETYTSYWSSTPCEFREKNAYKWSTNGGTVVSLARDTESFVQCVRRI